MSTHKPNQDYAALKAQMPVIEWTEATTQDFIEPLPVQAKQWLKFSRIALMSSVLFVVLGIGAVGISFTKLSSAQTELKKNRIQTKTALAGQQRLLKALKDRNLPAIIQQNSLVTALEPAMKQTEKWKVRDSNGQLEIEFQIRPPKDYLDVLSTLNQQLRALKWLPKSNSEKGNFTYLVIYGRE